MQDIRREDKHINNNNSGFFLYVFMFSISSFDKKEQNKENIDRIGYDILLQFIVSK